MVDLWGILLFMDVDKLVNCMAIVNPDIIVFHPQGEPNKNIGLVSLPYVCLFACHILKTFHFFSSFVSPAGNSSFFGLHSWKSAAGSLEVGGTDLKVSVTWRHIPPTSRVTAEGAVEGLEEEGLEVEEKGKEAAAAA